MGVIGTEIRRFTVPEPQPARALPLALPAPPGVPMEPLRIRDPAKVEVW